MELYLNFLKGKINALQSDDIDLIKNKDLMIKRLKTIIQKIREKAEYMSECLKIRNLLICLKEEVDMKQLPLIFTFFNRDNIDNFISNLNQSLDFYDIEKNNIKIPINLYEYLKKQHIDNNSLVSNKYKKYLDVKDVFSDIEEYNKKFKEFQLKIIENHQKCLSNYRTIDDFRREKQILYPLYKFLEEKYASLQNTYNELKISNDELENKKVCYYNLINGLTKKIRVRKIENYDRQIVRDRPLEESRFYLNFMKIFQEQKFNLDFAYVYFFISKIVTNLYNIFPELFHSSNNFNMNRFKECMNNISNCDNFKEDIIKQDSLYLLSLYETAITKFLQKYSKTIANIKDNNEIILIKRDILTNKNYELIKFQKTLEEYLNDRKRKKILLKNNKINLIKRNNFPDYSMILKHNK